MIILDSTLFLISSISSIFKRTFLLLEKQGWNVLENIEENLIGKEGFSVQKKISIRPQF